MTLKTLALRMRCKTAGSAEEYALARTSYGGTLRICLDTLELRQNVTAQMKAQRLAELVIFDLIFDLTVLDRLIAGITLRLPQLRRSRGTASSVYRGMST